MLPYYVNQKWVAGEMLCVSSYSLIDNYIIIIPLATKIAWRKNPLYANDTIVALTYACVQRHISCKWNILFINGFHHVNPW